MPQPGYRQFCPVSMIAPFSGFRSFRLDTWQTGKAVVRSAKAGQHRLHPGTLGCGQRPRRGRIGAFSAFVGVLVKAVQR